MAGTIVQTRYSTTYSVALTDVQTTMDVVAVPFNTNGYLTIRRGYSDQEDVRYTNISGLQLTGLLRGLSPTALTDTEVGGLKKTHALNSPATLNTVEQCHVHYVINDKTSMTRDEVVTGAWTMTNAAGIGITNGIFTSSTKYLPGFVKDVSGNELIEFTTVASAVNQLNIANAAIGLPIILQPTGGDTNISMEIKGKGTGVLTIPDASLLKTSAAPTTDPMIANKKYVDDQIAAAPFSNASTTVKGVVEEATDAEVAAQTTTGGTGARLFMNPGSTTVSTRTASKIPVTQTSSPNAGVIDPNIYDPYQIYAPKQIPLGETIAANDLCFLDESVMKWKKVTTGASTWNKKLAVCIDNGVLNDVGKRMLLRGYLSGQTFANINPTFSGAGTGADAQLDQSTATTAQGFLIDNSTGAECITTGGHISVKITGVPTAALTIALVLGNPDGTFALPAVWENGANALLGTVLATTTLAEAIFSGTYASYAFSWGANVKIPANSKCFLVFYYKTAADAANFYNLQVSSGAGSGQVTMSTAAGKSWSAIAKTGNYDLTITSTSPVGYSVKVAGTSGAFALCGNSLTNSWTRVIGYVLSATEMIFDPEAIRPSLSRGYMETYTSSSYGLGTYTLPYTPNSVNVMLGVFDDATVDGIAVKSGFIGGDVTNGSVFLANTNGNNIGGPLVVGINSAATQFTDPFTHAAAAITQASLTLDTIANNTHFVACVRLENGFQLYHGFTNGATYLGTPAGQVGFEIAAQMLIN